MELEGVKKISPIITELNKNYDQIALANAISLLIKLLSNIEKHPLDTKYRKIKMTNKTLKKKVFCIAGIEEILTSIGFTAQGEFYVFNQQSITPVDQSLIILRAREVQLRAVRTAQLTDAQRERMAELQREKKEHDSEMRRVLNGAKHDRDDFNKREEGKVYKDSKGKNLKFGANVMTAQECMPKRGK